MADELDIEPEFEDEDSFFNRITNKQGTPSSPQVDDISIEDDISASVQGLPPFQFSNKATKEQQDRIREEARKERERYRREQRELLAEAQAQQRAIANQTRQSRKDAIDASRANVRDIRQEATDAKIQAYSLAASIGLPGYVTSSVVDTFFIRPKLNEEINKQQEYQRQVKEYYDQLQNVQAQQAAQQRRNISNLPMRAIPVNTAGNTGWLPPIPPTPPTPPGNLPPGPNPQPQPQPIPPTPPGNLPPTPPTPPGNNPPGNPPGPPPTPSPFPSTNLDNPIQAAVAIIQGAQRLNAAIDRAAQATSSNARSFFNGDSIEGIQATNKAVQGIVDPLGINVPLNVAVQGFNTLLDVNKSMLELAVRNSAFAPQTLGATVERDIAKLIADIKQAQRLDPLTAQLVELNTRIDVAWVGFRTRIIEEYGPIIINLLKGMTTSIEIASRVVDPIAAIANNMLPNALGLLFNISKIGNQFMAMKDQEALDKLDANIMQELDKFFTPGPNPLNKPNRKPKLP